MIDTSSRGSPAYSQGKGNGPHPNFRCGDGCGIWTYSSTSIVPTSTYDSGTLYQPGISGMSYLEAYAPASVNSFYAYEVITDSYGNVEGPAVGTSLTISTSLFTNSGGHNHTSSNQPISTPCSSTYCGTTPCPFSNSSCQQTTCTTDSSGQCLLNLYTTYIGQFEAVEVCGITSCNGQEYAVAYTDISSMPTSGSTYTFKTQPAAHPSVNYATPTAQSGILAVLSDYEDYIGDATPIVLTDASLIFGGWNDFQSNWSCPHKAHGRGTAFDIKQNGGTGSVGSDPSIWGYFITSCQLNGTKTAIQEDAGTGNQHLHCEWPDSISGFAAAGYVCGATPGAPPPSY